MFQFVQRVFNRIVSEPALVTAAVIAGVNGATEQSWPAYGAAALTALLRFAVSPVVDKR